MCDIFEVSNCIRDILPQMPPMCFSDTSLRMYFIKKANRAPAMPRFLQASELNFSTQNAWEMHVMLTGAENGPLRPNLARYGSRTVEGTHIGCDDRSTDFNRMIGVITCFYDISVWCHEIAAGWLAHCKYVTFVLPDEMEMYFMHLIYLWYLHRKEKASSEPAMPWYLRAYKL